VGTGGVNGSFRSAFGFAKEHVLKRKKVSGVGRGRYLRQSAMIGRPTRVAGADKLQITIRLDPDLFLEVARFSRRELQSFNEAVAHLCEWGLEIDAEERVRREMI